MIIRIQEIYLDSEIYLRVKYKWVLIGIWNSNYNSKQRDNLVFPGTETGREEYKNERKKRKQLHEENRGWNERHKVQWKNETGSNCSHSRKMGNLIKGSVWTSGKWSTIMNKQIIMSCIMKLTDNSSG